MWVVDDSFQAEDGIRDLTVTGVQTCALPIYLKAARALSDRLGCPIVIHVSETKREVDDSIKAKGAPPIVYLDRIGFLNNKVIAAHVVWPMADRKSVV